MVEPVRKDQRHALDRLNRVPSEVCASAFEPAVQLDHEGQEAFQVLAESHGAVFMPDELLVAFVPIVPKALIEAIEVPAINDRGKYGHGSLEKPSRKRWVIKYYSVIVASVPVNAFALISSNGCFGEAASLALFDKSGAFIGAEEGFDGEHACPEATDSHSAGFL